MLSRQNIVRSMTLTFVPYTKSCVVVTSLLKFLNVSEILVMIPCQISM